MVKKTETKQATDAKIVLVKMVLDDGKEADVHPAEVENYKRGGWKVKD